MTDDPLTREALRQIYLFAALNDAQLDIMLASSHPIQLKQKQILFEAGQPAESFYLLQTGQVKLYSLSADGDEKVIEIIRPGETFAEAIAFMEQHAYPVSAEAIMDSSLCSFDLLGFRRLLEDSPATSMRLMADMSRRLRMRINEINNLTLHNATYRLVVYLLEQIPEGAMELAEIHLGTPKSIIASRLSIKPETFSRILSKLTQRGLISVEGNNISLQDVNGLRALL
ncbi:MAG: Crp/Fnr family transcriptional regulator [Proteobacteria bacterium]|jgi:CRP-like cAMP-binding protein|nr:Crp/Fnr family transcriptional regulator [Pseudomonadota bacterium]